MILFFFRHLILNIYKINVFQNVIIIRIVDTFSHTDNIIIHTQCIRAFQVQKANIVTLYLYKYTVIGKKKAREKKP